MLRLVLSEYDSFERKIGDEIAKEMLPDEASEADVVSLIAGLIEGLNEYQRGNWEHEPVSVRLIEVRTGSECVLIDEILR